MASSLSAKQPVINCCGCCQHSIQLKLLTTARQLPAHSARRQTAICATSTSTNTCVVVRTHSQQRIGLRSHLGRRPVTLQRAYGESNGSSKDPSLQDYVEVKIESVKVNAGSSVVYLRVVGGDGTVIPVHIGEQESNALLREINKPKAKQQLVRPLTHELMRDIVKELGYRVTKVRITEIRHNTYYARVHIARTGEAAEVDIDARPSDAINLAVRFEAPVFVSKRIAELAAPPPPEPYTSERQKFVEASVRETLSSYEDPTIMFQLQKELAVKEERFEDAQSFQEHIVHEMTHNRLLALVVAMESALADKRWEEAEYFRDEYKKELRQQELLVLEGPQEQEQQQTTQAPADRQV